MTDATQSLGETNRPGFMEWVREFETPDWPLLPLTHVTSCFRAEQVLRGGRLDTAECQVFGEPLVYFFYGRPAYRLKDAAVIKREVFSPFCFVFRPALIESASAIHAFDSGALSARLYNHVLADEMRPADFRLDCPEAANKLINGVFQSRADYLMGDISKIRNVNVSRYQFAAQSYLDLLGSPGRNEPDDRAYTIEVISRSSHNLSGNLMAMVMPHTLWDENAMAPWLKSFKGTEIEVEPYEFQPGKSPEFYYCNLLRSVREIFRRRNFL